MTDTAEEADPSRPFAHILQVVSDGDDASRTIVHLVVHFADGKQAKLEFAVDATQVEREALPEVVRRELHCFLDEVEALVEDPGRVTFGVQRP
jgi:hypothetical protein